ncbi:MAG: PAS domain S-box protein [bacterium]
MAKVGAWEFFLDKPYQNWTEEIFKIHEVEPGFKPTVAAGINFYAPDSRPIIQKAVDRAIKLGEPFDLELELITAKNNRRFVHAVGKAIKMNSKVVGVSGIFQDTTEHRVIEQELKLQSEIFRNIADGIYLIRIKDAKIVYTNPKFEKMFGYGPGEMIGRDVAIVNAPTKVKPEETVKVIMGLAEKTGEWHGEVQNIKKDGTPFWSYANVTTFEHPEFGKVLVAVHSDISERKEAERILIEKNEQNEKMNKLMVGRELKMIELKERIQTLETELAKKK